MAGLGDRVSGNKLLMLGLMVVGFFVCIRMFSVVMSVSVNPETEVIEAHTTADRGRMKAGDTSPARQRQTKPNVDAADGKDTNSSTTSQQRVGTLRKDPKGDTSDTSTGASTSKQKQKHAVDSSYRWEEATRALTAPLSNEDLDADWGLQEMDAVIMWVDGSAPGYQEEMLKAYQKTTRDWNKTVIGTSRVRDNNELQYCLRSLEKNAKFIRRIFLVTNGQLPKWLDLSANGITHIKHSDIFEPRFLPTYNTMAIYAAVSNIEGLSEFFLLLDDDFFFNKPNSVSDFWTPEEGMKLLAETWGGVRRKQFNCMWCNAIEDNNVLLDKWFGTNKKRPYLPHRPQLMRRSIVQEMKALWPDKFEETMSSKFRSDDDVEATWMMHMFAIERWEGRGVEDNDIDGDGVLSARELNVLEARLGGSSLSSFFPTYPLRYHHSDVVHDGMKATEINKVPSLQKLLQAAKEKYREVMEDATSDKYIIVKAKDAELAQDGFAEIEREKPMWFCVNDGVIDDEALDADAFEELADVREKFFQKKFPKKSSFELGSTSRKGSRVGG